MVSAIFKGKVLATAGPMPGQFTEENITKWTELRGGSFSQELDERVTHLLCTKEQLEKRGPRVQAVLKSYEKVHLVDIDWFNLSCQANKREKERAHDLRSFLKEKRKRERRLAQYAKAEDQEDKFVNTNLFHVYRDENNFPYEVTITRDDEETGNTGQKYVLYVRSDQNNLSPQHMLSLVAGVHNKPHVQNQLT